MPRIIVTADHTDSSDPTVLLEETVQSVHLSSDHAARQLIERLAWALDDANELGPRHAQPDARPRRASDPARERQRIAA